MMIYSVVRTFIDKDLTFRTHYSIIFVEEADMGEEQEGQAQEVQSEEAQATKVLRLEIRIDPETSQHLEKLANYAALEGIIPSDHRGNKAAWINYCLVLGEEALKQRAYQKRGF